MNLPYVRNIVCLLSLACLLCGTADSRAAYLESDVKDGVEVVPPRPIPPPHPDPVDDNELVHLMRRVRVEPPITYRQLTVFALSVSNPGSMRDIVTLSEAVARGWIEIREKGNAEVPYVTVRNRSRQHVFFMAGEILAGGRQNRVVRDDVLLPPGGGAVDIPVYCVEQGRWHGASDDFGKSPGVVHPALRSEALRGASQDGIWGEVASQGRRVGVDMPDGDYGALLSSAPVRRRFDEYMPHFRRIPRRGTVGAVFCSGGRIIGCELFSGDQLFEELWPRLLQAYCMEAGWADTRRVREPSERDVRRFIGLALTADYLSAWTPGTGTYLRIRGAVSGAALIWRGALVHATFSRRPHLHPIEPEPMPPVPVPLPRPELR